MLTNLAAFGAWARVVCARTQASAASPYVRYGGASLLFIASVSAIVWGYRSCECFDRQYDDAYITFRYAHQLATGHGLVFNAGDPTDSASSFSYTVLLAAFELIGFHRLPRVAATLGVASAAGIASLVYLACLERTRRPLLAFALGFITSLHGLIAAWSVSGMETLPYSVLVSAVVYRVFVRHAFGWLEAGLVFAAFLTRFEGALLVVAWGLVGVWRFVHAQRRERVQLARYALTLAALFLCFLALKYRLYGTLIPHAFALKTITTLYAPNPDALWSVWRAELSPVLLLAAIGCWTLPRAVQSVAWVLYVAVSAVSLVQGPSADYARYSVHMLPVVLMLACVPLARLFQLQFLAGWLTLGLLGYDAYSSFTAHRDSARVGAGHAKCRQDVGAYLEKALPAGTLILSSDIGVIAYAAPSQRFVDAVGLTSKDVLQARAEGKNVDAVLEREKPRYVADTCGGSCSRIEDFAVYNWLTQEHYWRTPLPPQTYTSRLQKGELLYSCRSPDGLQFAVSAFELADKP